ncbi:DUF4267 domain-containing protein [Euzebya rosea]|uniref:DUF4267 domain-containing protein n=1 Tax=Euzebya rosea TaxID=2052804 RepID=UPI000D3EAEEB|nr:DUF4267 domain-containing protein [Euzebya rosea]
MNKYSVAAATAAIGFGAGELLAPDRTMKVFGVADEDLSPSMRTIVRAFGARNLSYGAMMLTKQGRKALLAALPLFVASEAAAAGLSVTRDEVSPVLPALGAGATLVVAALLVKGR